MSTQSFLFFEFFQLWAWGVHRELSECRHLAGAARRVDREPAVALSQVQRGDQVVPEHPDPLVACLAWEVRELPRSDFAAVYFD